MEKKIIFQKCSFNYIFFVLYFITCFAYSNVENKIISKTIEEVNEKYLDYYYQIFEMLFIYIFTLSDFLAIIPFLIKTLCLNRKKDGSNYKDYDQIFICIGKNNDESLIYNNANQTEYYKKVKMMVLCSFLIAFFDFLSEYII